MDSGDTDPLIGGFAPTALGMKAAFFLAAEESVAFRPILGWATVSNYTAINSRPFVAVVIGPDNYPSLAAPPVYPNYIGVFPESASVEDALESYRSGLNAPRPPSTETDRALE